MRNIKGFPEDFKSIWGPQGVRGPQEYVLIIRCRGPQEYHFSPAEQTMPNQSVAILPEQTNKQTYQNVAITTTTTTTATTILSCDYLMTRKPPCSMF